MKKIILPGSVLLSFLILSWTFDAQAEMYKYIDKDGVICFADDLQQVPEKYRSAVVIIEESSEYKPKALAPTAVQNNEQPLPAEEAANRPVHGRRPLSFRLMISGALSMGVLLIILVAGKVPELKTNEKMRAITRNSLIGALSVYLIFAHGKDVMTAVGIMGSAVEEAQQHSAEKGRKAAQAMKALDAMFQEAQLEKSANTEQAEKAGADQNRQ